MDSLRRRIPEDELTFKFTRSRGPGGQNVNTLSTRATLLFDLDRCEALSPEQKQRVRSRLHGRISKEGMLRVVSMRHRTQRRNREAAVDRFYELLAVALRRPKPRKPTTVPARTRRKRLVDKRKRGELKRLRGERRPSHTDD